MYMYVHMLINNYLHVDMDVDVLVDVHSYVCIHVCVLRKRICLHAHICNFIYTYMHMHICICIYVYAYIYILLFICIIYVYISTNRCLHSMYRYAVSVCILAWICNVYAHAYVYARA